MFGIEKAENVFIIEQAGITMVIDPAEVVKSGDAALVELHGAEIITTLNFRKCGSVRLEKQGIIAQREEVKIIGKVIQSYRLMGIKTGV